MKKIQNFDFDCFDLIEDAQNAYSFQPALTEKLDNHQREFDEKTILEIVLWKTNRYPTIPEGLIDAINDLRNNYHIEKAKVVLRQLLSSKGFDLPMASTVLRFACPDELQILDQRVYRFIMPEHDRLKAPYNIDEKVEFYFDYVDNLKLVCDKYQIPFSKSDRILYQLDKNLNADIPIKY